MQCSLVGIHSCILKMKTVGFSKTLVNLYHMTLYHTPEDRVIVFVTMITLNLPTGIVKDIEQVMVVCRLPCLHAGINLVAAMIVM